ncbi:Tautomerase/MIF superfamily [Tricladium varicosporioides]|nr:Tautomerase/MIF superfamily [Hymenoscyphus varicosporioides]
MTDIDRTQGWGHPRLGREKNVQALHLTLASERPRTASTPNSKWPGSPVDSDGTMYDPSALWSPTNVEHPEVSESDYGFPGQKEQPFQNWTAQQSELANIKRQYYDDIFTNRDPFGTDRVRAEKGSVIMAEIKTNITIRDEYAFCTKFSQILSTRYQRPETSIMVTVVQPACLFFGGSFDPAYIMTLTAIPTQLQPATNRRNAYLLGKSLEEVLGITPNRGLFRFVPLGAENTALGGTTLAADVAADLENENPRPRTARLWSLGIDKRKQSVGALRSSRSPSQTSAATSEKNKSTPPSEPPTPTTPPLSEIQKALAEDGVHIGSARRLQPSGRKKSFAVIFGVAT